MIKSIDLTNFQKHESLHVKFEPGLNLITGPNWAGKTTILRGILFGLFGPSVLDVNLHHLKTSNKDGMKVILSLSIDGEDFIVTRSRTIAKIVKDGVLIASGQTDTTREIEERLGLSSKNFKYLNVSQQGEADLMLSMGAAAVNDLLNEVTGVDLVDAVITKASVKATEFAWSVNSLTTLSERLSNLKESISKKESESQELEEWLTKANIYHAALKERKEKEAANVSKMETDLIRAESARKELVVLEKRVADAKKEADMVRGSLKAVDPIILSELRNKIEAISHSVIEHDSKSRYLETLLRKQALLQENIYKAQSALNSIPETTDDPAELLKKKSSLEEQKAALLQKVSSLSKSITEAVCPTCGSVIKEVKLEDLRKEYKTASEEYSMIASKATEFSKHYEKVLEDIRNRDNLVNECGRHRTDLEETNLIIDEQTKYIQSLGDMTILSKDLEELTTAQTELTYAARMYEERSEKLIRLEKQLAEDVSRATRLTGLITTTTEEDVLAARAVRDQAKAEEEEWGTSVFQQTTRLAVLDNDIKSDMSTAEKVGEEYSRAEEGCNKHKSYKDLEKHIRKNRDKYLSDIWNSVLLYASTFVQKATSGKITEFRRSAKGFSYIEDDCERPTALASGQQKAVLGVALKLALGASLGAGRRLLLLDEVTAAASDENSMLVCQLLSGHSGQVILVTHREADAAAADHTISVS